MPTMPTMRADARVWGWCRPAASESQSGAARLGLQAAVENQRMVTPRQSDMIFKSLLTPREVPTQPGQPATQRQSLQSSSSSQSSSSQPSARQHTNNLTRTVGPGGQPWSREGAGESTPPSGAGSVGAPR
eukprot:46204-Rhodomonas_salina.2